MDHQAPDGPRVELSVGLSFQTPVVNCEINSRINIRAFDSTGTQVTPVGHSIEFTWYREQIYCSIHRSSLATYQCIDCVDLKLAIEGSYHCTTQCFMNEWERHKKDHHNAAEAIRSSSESNHKVPEPLRGDDFWPHFYSYSKDDKNAIVVKRDGKAWTKVASSKFYVPSIGDLGCKLRLEYVAKDCSTGSHLCPVNVILTDPVIQFPSPPLPRCMIKIKNLQKQSSNGVTFTVLSYNILADLYAVYEQIFPKWALAWEYRRKNLLREIIGYHADIICLQEVQSDHFESFFKPQLTNNGYSVMYKKKTKEVYTHNKYVIDGCATFYRKELFKEIVKYEVEFGETARSVVEALEPEKRKQGQIRLMKDNVALVVILEPVKNGSNPSPLQSRICVANTHIHANTNFPDAKLFQVSQLVNGLEKIAQSKIPLLICGDLNSVPKSDPYKLVVSGKIDEVLENEDDPLGVYQHLKLQHSLPLESAYSVLFRSDLEQQRNMNPDTHEPVFTNHRQIFSGTLDYIFFTDDSLKVESVLEPLDREDIGGPYLPSSSWSSDHIALMAQFRYKPPYCRGLRAPIPPNPWLSAAPGC